MRKYHTHQHTHSSTQFHNLCVTAPRAQTLDTPTAEEGRRCFQSMLYTSAIHGRPLCTYAAAVFLPKFFTLFVRKTPFLELVPVSSDSTRQYVWYRRTCSRSPVINFVVLVVRGRNSRSSHTASCSPSKWSSQYICAGMPSLAVGGCAYHYSSSSVSYVAQESAPVCT